APLTATGTTRGGWERHPPSVGSAAHEVARRLVIADPEVPRGKLRSEGRVGLASPARAADPLRVAPDHLRVVATLLPRCAAIARVVVILRLACPGGGRVREGPTVCRGAGRDVLATVSASRVVLVHAPVRPGLRYAGGFRRPGERRKRRIGRGSRGAPYGVVRIEPSLRLRGRRRLGGRAGAGVGRARKAWSARAGEKRDGDPPGRAHRGESSHRGSWNRTPARPATVRAVRLT